ncbi:hypothetical protein AMK59_5259 [Oryctes borbonicus]|uniref:Queuosine 5'-phosphate N-glycosylase/hydrolase n=1 Tax=Oryctes borbonicus TaxID=1629725 RepID=A0A0T6B262_9SCAR|nr:hypothetical protein AMK59_5259 [Oryctes borbonicus]
MLENRRTREFLYDFVDKYARNEPSSNAPIRSAPKPPPYRAPPPPPARSQHPSPKQKDQSVPPNFAPPPPPPPPRSPSLSVPATNSSAPPPPPPPLPIRCVHTESIQKSSNVSPIENKGGDMRSALLESIRQGTTLKTASTSPPTTRSEEPDRDDLLKQIKEGVSLRSATDRELNSPRTSVSEVNDIAMALKKAVEISPTEVEIRGCSIHAVELIKLYVSNKIDNPQKINSILIDHFLWDFRRKNAKKILTDVLPFHKTFSIYY